MLSGVAGQANDEWRRLQEQWRATHREWRDDIAARFTREFWNKWETDIPRFMRHLNELEDTLDRALSSLKQ